MLISEVTQEHYAKTVDGKKPVTRSRGGGRVIIEDDKIIKVFSPRKNGFYFFRFLENVDRLNELDIKVMELIGCYHVASTDIYYMEYKPLIGTPLRDYLRQNQRDRKMMSELAAFFAHVHGLGIYFRSIHFGNIIVLPEGGFGLIDFGNMTIYNKPLNTWHRARNFRIFTRKNYYEDFYHMLQYRLSYFIDEYLSASGFSTLRKKIFLTWLRMYCNQFNHLWT